MSGDLIHVVGCPHPLRSERVESFVVSGQTLEQIVHRGLIDLNVPRCMWGHGHAYVGETYVPPDMWGKVAPQPGAMVTYRIIPQGGGGKDPFRTILSIVVVAVSMWAGGAAGAMFLGTGMSSAVSGITTFGLTALGMLAINSLIPMSSSAALSSSKDKSSSVYSISGSSNQINKFGAVPVLLGRHRITPPQAALPYTELSGDDQYVMQLFCLGYTGDGIEIESELRVGETDIADYDEFNYEIIEGATEGTLPKYYQNDVYETSLAIELIEADGWTTRTTDQPAHTFSIDLVAPQGLRKYNTSTGDTETFTVELEVKWRFSDTETWYPLGGTNHVVAGATFTPTWNKGLYDGTATVTNIYVSSEGVLKSGTSVPSNGFGVVRLKSNGSTVDLREAGEYTGLAYSVSMSSYGNARVTVAGGTCVLSTTIFTSKKTTAIRRTVSPGKVTDTPSYFDVSVRRVTADKESESIIDTLNWATLRAINYQSPIGKTSAVNIISIRVKATGELSGAIEELNMDAVSHCPDWDSSSSSWITRATNNPASLYRYVLQHPANAKRKADSTLNLAVLQDWHEFCDEKGLTYGRYFDFTSSVTDVLKEIAAAGLASIDRTDGLWSVVVERARDTWKQLFTPRNSWNFRATRAFPDMPHAWRVTYYNEDEEYQADEAIVYADGYDETTATLFEGIEFPGVTNFDQVVKLGRQHYADALLCREEYSFEVDFEHLVCTRGDRIKCAHPVTLWGIAQGRVKSVDAGTQMVEVDEPCSMVIDKAYSIRWRSDTGGQFVRSVVTDTGERMVLALTGDGALPTKGDVFAFGETGTETVDLLVKQVVDRGEHLSARLICKDYVAEVYDAVGKTLPAYKTNITVPYGIIPVVPPVITKVRSAAAVVNGTVLAHMQVDFTAQEGETVQFQYKELGASLWVDAGRFDRAVGVAIVGSVVDATTYDIRARTVKSLVTSVWVTTTHTYSLTEAMIALSASWSASTSGFAAVVQNGYINFSWILHQNITSYEIRYGDSWNTGVTIAEGVTANTWTWKPTQTTSLTFYLKGTITKGWQTTETALVQVAVTPPSITAMSAKVIGNNVLLYWTNVSGTHDIASVELVKGTDYATAEIIGTVSGTFATGFESAAGTYKYWATPVDTIGLRGEPASVYAVVSAPAGYVFLSKTMLGWDGVATNLFRESGYLYGPVNTAETFAEHFVTNGYDSPQAQIDVGLPFFLQPGETPAAYSETIDHGAIVSASSITLSLTRSTVVGTITVIPTISYSLDGVTWTAASAGSYSVFGTNFRYTKTELAISSPDHGLVAITAGSITLDAQAKEDTIYATAVSTDAGGTPIAISGFMDISQVILSSIGSTPIFTACDYVDTGNPTEIRIYAFNISGVRVTAALKCTIKGV